MEPTMVQSAKLAVLAAINLSKDALHIHVGLLVYLTAIAMTRRPVGSLLPWSAVLITALMGETFDMRDDVATLGQWRWVDSAHDVVNTVLWPTILLMLAKTTHLLDPPPR
jgi:hypothetical protein